MKKIVILVILISSSFGFSQDDFFVRLHYITYKNSDAKDVIEHEKKYWSKVHKANIDSGSKIAWDMWEVQVPKEEGHTTFVYAHLEPINHPGMLGINPQEIFSKDEWSSANKLRPKRVRSRGIETVYKGGFVPAAGQKPTNFVVLNFMDVKKNAYVYEQMELNRFMPIHKKNKFIKGWGLHKVVYPLAMPFGQDKTDYITADFYESYGDIMRRYSKTSKPSNSPQAIPMGEIRENLRQEVFKLVLSER